MAILNRYQERSSGSRKQGRREQIPGKRRIPTAAPTPKRCVASAPQSMRGGDVSNVENAELVDGTSD